MSMNIENITNPFSHMNIKNINSGHDAIANNSFEWFISADKIFSSQVEQYEDYGKFHYMELLINKFSMHDDAKSTDSAVCGHDVKIFLPPSRSCAMILGNLASGKEISKIFIKKTALLYNAINVLEEKEFSKCTIQSFERKGEIAAFSFRYVSYFDSYQDFKAGAKLGKSATKIDLATWEIENS